MSDHASRRLWISVWVSRSDGLHVELRIGTGGQVISRHSQGPCFSSRHQCTMTSPEPGAHGEDSDHVRLDTRKARSRT